MKALIIGATGATGKDLVNILLSDPAYTEVVAFVRRPGGIIHSKLTEVLTNFEKLEDVAGRITGDVVFSCLGTTLKDAGSKDKQWHIDYEIPLEFVTIARNNNVPKMVLLSAYGAKSSARVFYSMMKGKLEEAIDSLSFHQYIIFRPGMLQRKGTTRLAERITNVLLKALNGMGLIRKFRPLPTSVLAEKLAKAPKVLTMGNHTIELDKIFVF